VFIRISFGLPVPEAVRLLIPLTAGLFHENTVPGVRLVGMYEKSALLQIGEGVRTLVSTGIGFTVTETSYVEEFVHPFAARE